MKKCVIALLALCMVVPTLDARPKRKKAGEIKDQTYVDKKYDFTMKVRENWDATVEDADDPNRLVLIQSDPAIPPDYAQAEDYTMFPRLVVYRGETKLSPFEFVDSVMSNSYESDTKEDFLKEAELFRPEPNREDIVTVQKRTITIDGHRCVVWVGRTNYVQNVQTSASSLGGKRVYGAYQGAVWVIKLENKDVLIANLICERDYFQDVYREAAEMINSLDWPGNDEDEKQG